MKKKFFSIWRCISIAAMILLTWGICSAHTSAASVRYAEGDEGLAVASIQLKLKKMGYFQDAITGKYDKKTAAAVRELQKAMNAQPDGIVNDDVYRVLNGGRTSIKTGDRPAGPVAPAGRSAVPVVNTAMQYLGTPYRFGGAAPGGFDCSGYTSYVFARHGLKLPRTADIQYKTGKPVNRAALQPGDLVFFTTYEPGASHVGIYTANGRFIHASSSKGVMVSGLDENYWKARYLGARRIL